MCVLFIGLLLFALVVVVIGSTRAAPSQRTTTSKMCLKKRAYWIHFRFLSSDWLYILTATCTYCSAPTAAATTKLLASSLLYTQTYNKKWIKSQGNALLYTNVYYIYSLLAFLLLLPHGIDFTGSILWREWKRRKYRICDVVWSSVMHFPPPSFLQCSSGLLMSIYITE